MMTDETSKPYTIDRAPPDFLDGSMTRSELVAALEGSLAFYVATRGWSRNKAAPSFTGCGRQTTH
jgi:hypothetical protein